MSLQLHCFQKAGVYLLRIGWQREVREVEIFRVRRYQRQRGGGEGNKTPQPVLVRTTHKLESELPQL